MSKLNNSRSKFAVKEEDDSTFNQTAEQVHSKRMENNQKAFELGKAFLNILNDKTLSENKGPIAKSTEVEILTGLIEYGTSMNNDENESEGTGSIAIIMILLRSILILKDKINALEYSINSLNKKY